MNCFICKKEFDKKEEMNAVSLSHGSEIVYVHPNHTGVADEYNRQYGIPLTQKVTHGD